VLREAVAQLRAYFAGERTRFDLPLDLQGGTGFQQSVWQALLAIPPGGTTSYGELGRRLGRPQAARAVGAAVGRNPLSIVVPCHRVLGTGGSLTGYAGGPGAQDRAAAPRRRTGTLTRMSIASIIDFVVLAALWGSSFLFMRLAVVEFGAVPTAAVRVAVAAVFLLPLMLWKGHGALFRKHWWKVCLIGIPNSALPFALFSFALLSITTGLSAILNATVPLFGALVAWWWLKDRPTGSRVLGLMVGFVGIALLAWDKASFKPDASGVAPAWAVIACLVATLSYAIAASGTKRYLTGLPPLLTATGSQVGATLGLALPALWLWPDQMPGGQAWLALVALGRALHGRRVHPLLPPDRADRPGACARRHLCGAGVRHPLWRLVPGRAGDALDDRVRGGDRLRHGLVHRPAEAAVPAPADMNSARQLKLRLAQPKPRNPLVVAAAQRKAGSHRKTKSAERQAQKSQLKKQLKDL
jgi:O-6-methylguanine DNA methyltransferase